MTASRPRARDLGIRPGILSPGPLNAITDVGGVLVGHSTLIEGERIRTGATAILPHGGNPFRERVPAGLTVANGFGKLMGATQIAELGEIETPIVLTNTLSIGRASDAITEWTLSLPGNERVRSVNPVVGETNDSELNDIRARRLSSEHVLQAIRTAAAGPVAEGAVGAGTGTISFGWKGGIGTASRVLPPQLGGYALGVLVQSNYGGVLQADGVRVGEALGQFYLREELDDATADGSIMIVIATDAPLSDRNLTRLSARAIAGLARTGSSFTNGSGDYAIAFSTAAGVRRNAMRREQVAAIDELPNDLVSPLFQAAIEATEEAIWNSMLLATDMHGYSTSRDEPSFVPAFPVGRLDELLRRR